METIYIIERSNAIFLIKELKKSNNKFFKNIKTVKKSFKYKKLKYFPNSLLKYCFDCLYQYEFLIYEEFEGYNINKNQNQIFVNSIHDLPKLIN